VPAQVRVVPVDLQVSAVAVDAHADTMKARHATADGRVEASQRGVPMGSATALGAAMIKWQADSARLFARMTDHSTALRTSAAAYAGTDQDSGAGIHAVAATIRPEDMNL
jgi:hypothetical protein